MKSWYRIANKDFAPFLETPELAIQWAIENTDIESWLPDEEVPEYEGAINVSEDQYKQALKDYYTERAEAYSAKYHQVKDLPQVTIYRSVMLKNIDDIDWDNVGTHWSFEKSGAGAYGDVSPTVRKKGKEYVLTGVVEPQYIDWEYCFTSFMYYGEDQWECALDELSPITVTHVDDKPINPIQAAA